MMLNQHEFGGSQALAVASFLVESDFCLAEVIVLQNEFDSSPLQLLSV